MSVEKHSLAWVPWQFFCTFTFKPTGLFEKNTLKSAVVGFTMFVSLIRKLGSASHLHFRDVLWALRGELGEQGGKFHFHALISGLPNHWQNETTCFFLKNSWESLGGGMSRVRVYQEDLDGLDYILKDLEASVAHGGNLYELTKFGGTTHVTLSNSLVSRIRYERSLGHGHKKTRIQAIRKAAQSDSV